MSIKQLLDDIKAWRREVSVNERVPELDEYDRQLSNVEAQLPYMQSVWYATLNVDGEKLYAGGHTRDEAQDGLLLAWRKYRKMIQRTGRRTPDWPRASASFEKLSDWAGTVLFELKPGAGYKYGDSEPYAEPATVEGYPDINLVGSREGWGIFNSDELCRDDEAGVFEDDAAAIRFVTFRARRGSAVHRVALEWCNLPVPEIDSDVEAAP